MEALAGFSYRLAYFVVRGIENRGGGQTNCQGEPNAPIRRPNRNQNRSVGGHRSYQVVGMPSPKSQITLETDWKPVK